MGVNVGEAFITVRPDTKGFAQEAESGIRGPLTGAFKAVGVAATAALAGAGVALAGLGAWGLKSAADMQQVEIAFEGILGSGQEAKSFLDDLRAFAAKTPFEFPELARSAKNLLAVGYNADQVIPIMTTLGNVAATLGVGGDAIEGVVRALGQMQGKGKASAEELQQISEQIPGFSAIGAIAEGMGISVAEAFDKMSQGAIPADEAIRLILEGMEKFPGAAGAMERQSLTLNGVLSTLKDTARDALVLGIGPILPLLAAAITDSTPQIQGALTEIGKTFGGLVTAAAPILDAVLPVFTQIASIVGTFLTGALTALAPAISALVSAFTPLIEILGSTLTPIIEALAPILLTLAQYFRVFIERLRDTGILEKFSEFLGKILQAIEPLIEEGLLALLRAFDAMSPIFPMLGKFMEDLIPIIREMLKALKPVIKQLGDELVKSVQQLLPHIPALLDSFVRFLDALIPLLPALTELAVLFLKLIPVVAEIQGKFYDQLAAIFLGLAIIINGLVDAARWLRDRWNEYFPAIRAGVEEAWQQMQPVFDALKSVLGEVTDAAGWVRDRFVEVWPIISGAVSTAWGIIRPVLEFLRDRLNDIIGVVSWLKDNGGGAFTAIQDGIVNLWNAVSGPLDSFWGILKHIYNTIKNIIDALPHVPGISNLTGGMSIDEAIAAAAAAGPDTSGIGLQGLASGGIITRPTLAVVAEGGEAEAVIPLSRLDRMLSTTGAGVTVNMYGSMDTDPVRYAYLTGRTLLAYMSAAGR